MINLYKILGVKEDATMDEIKKAHRKKAKETHPDRGGNPKDFHLVSVAGRVLRSEKDRAKYDATGSYEETKTEDPFTKAEKILVEYFFKILSTLTPEKIEHEDLFNTILNFIKKDQEQFKQQRRATEVNIEMQQKVLKKISRKGEKTKGLIFDAINNNIDTLKRSIENLTTEIKDLELALTLLADYSYNYTIKKEDPEELFRIGSGDRGHFRFKVPPGFDSFP